MSYTVKEIYYTLQGEGAHTGRPAVFLRFAGCNLWTGREEDREDAICSFCDTDFVGVDGPGGGRYREPEDLARAVAGRWPTIERWPSNGNQPLNGNQLLNGSRLSDGRSPSEGGSSGRPPSEGGSSGRPYVVATGGEPLLQLDDALVAALHDAGFEVAIESNGTIPAPEGIDWLCISPKAGAPLVQRSGDELKLVYPQEGALPGDFKHLDFGHFYLQPMDGPDIERNTRLAVEYCLTHPQWRLSLQTHKTLGIP